MSISSADSSYTETKEPQQNQANVERYLGEKDRYKEFLVNGPVGNGSASDRQIQETLNKTKGQGSAGNGEGKGRDPGLLIFCIPIKIFSLNKKLRTDTNLFSTKANSKI